MRLLFTKFKDKQFKDYYLMYENKFLVMVDYMLDYQELENSVT